MLAQTNTLLDGGSSKGVRVVLAWSQPEVTCSTPQGFGLSRRQVQRCEGSLGEGAVDSPHHGPARHHGRSRTGGGSGRA
jgi:hypothetical protein